MTTFGLLTTTSRFELRGRIDRPRATLRLTALRFGAGTESWRQFWTASTGSASVEVDPRRTSADRMRGREVNMLAVADEGGEVADSTRD